jgi:soluble lytic murein transglycosylase
MWPLNRNMHEGTELANAMYQMKTVRTLLPWALLLAVSGTAAALQTSTPPKAKHHKVAAHHATHHKTARPQTHVRHVKTRRKPRSARSIARSRKLQQAFVASTQLRPMAQELTALRRTRG